MIGTKTQPKSSSSTDEFNGFINRIFSAIAANYPAWAEKHLSDDEKRLITKRLWRYALKDLTNNHISNGIERMLKECEFPPVPATFRKLCFNAKGVPELSQAFTEALNGNYSCKLVKRAAELTGIFDLRKGTETDASLRKRYEYNHIQLLSKLIRGESIDAPVTKAIETTKKPTSFGACDDLIEKEIQSLVLSGKSGYEQFRALKIKRG